jgi:hypothetical protein
MSDKLQFVVNAERNSTPASLTILLMTVNDKLMKFVGPQQIFIARD